MATEVMASNACKRGGEIWCENREAEKRKATGTAGHRIYAPVSYLARHVLRGELRKARKGKAVQGLVHHADVTIGEIVRITVNVERRLGLDGLDAKLLQLP
jgi:hypothetical protein